MGGRNRIQRSATTHRPPLPSPQGSDASGSADNLVLMGLEAHRAGRLQEAHSHYSQALQRQPDHADALNLLGALSFQRGDVDAAIRLIGKSVRIRPSYLDAYLNLAEALEKAARVTEAVETCHQALRVAPDFAEAHARLARLTAEHGIPLQALAHSRVALALDPDSLEGLCARGLALRRLRRFKEAETAYRRSIELDQVHLPSLTGLAALCADVDKAPEAADLYRRAIETTPGDLDLTILLAELLQREGDAPGALEVYDRALCEHPNSVAVLFGRGNCLRDIGDFDGAQDSYRRALQLDADFAPAILALARMKRLGGDAGQRSRVSTLIADQRQPLRHRVQAAFAMGDAMDQAGDPDGAFRRFTEANRLYAKLRQGTEERFIRRDLREQVDLTADRLARDYAEHTAAWGSPSDLPVFVVGLPRSGTTLVEQICASHSQVFGAGELLSIRRIAGAIAAHNEGVGSIADWDVKFSRAEADDHVAHLSRLGRGAARVVDKTPLNLMRLGLAGALFPNARVIRCRRDSRDVAVSNHTMYFPTGNVWSNDQTDCGFAIREIERLGDVWTSHSPLRILDVVYEELVSDLDAHVRRIIDFLGLDWETACLDFQATARHVNTPSSWQVRQPIYSTSVGRWRRYEKHIGPMLAALAAQD